MCDIFFFIHNVGKDNDKESLGKGIIKEIGCLSHLMKLNMQNYQIHCIGNDIINEIKYSNIIYM